MDEFDLNKIVEAIEQMGERLDMIALALAEGGEGGLGHQIERGLYAVAEALDRIAQR